jgi:hypothetical protein
MKSHQLKERTQSIKQTQSINQIRERTQITQIKQPHRTRSAVESQGIAVREMKFIDASKPKIDVVIKALNELKLEKASIERQF